VRAEHQEQVPENEKPKKKTHIIARNIKKIGGKPSEKKTEKKASSKTDDYVTLTQNQFDKILETIGELTLAAEKATEPKNDDNTGL